MAKALEDTLLEQELTCPVCLEIYQEPHLLPCGHNFCLKCLQRLESNANRGRLRCPECRESHRCATRWQKNFKLASISAGFQQRSYASQPSPSRPGPSYRPTDVHCDYCVPEITGDTVKRSATAVKSCLKCEVSMCPKHVQHHLELPAFQNHPLVEPLSDMRKRKCTDHDKMFRYYCMEECKFLCSVCTLEGGPSGHAIKTLKNTMHDLQASLRKQLQKVNRKIRKVEKNMQEQNELQQQNKAFLEGVDKQVDTFRGVLMSKMDELLTSLSECLRAYGENSLSIQQHLVQIEEDRSRLEVLRTGIEHLLQKNDPFQFIKEYMACAESYRGLLKKPLSKPCLSRSLRMDREVIGNRLEDKMENFMTYLREHVTTFLITVCSSDEEYEEMEEDELEEEDEDEEEEDEDEEEEEEDDSDEIDSITEEDEMNED